MEWLARERRCTQRRATRVRRGAQRGNWLWLLLLTSHRQIGELVLVQLNAEAGVGVDAETPGRVLCVAVPYIF